MGSTFELACRADHAIEGRTLTVR